MSTQEQIQAAINVMNDHGIDFRAPWECTLDDREQERFEALRDAIDAALSLAQPQGAQVQKIEDVGGFERDGIARCLFNKAMSGHAQWDEMTEPNKEDWRVRADAWILDTTSLIEMSRSLRTSTLSRPHGGGK